MWVSEASQETKGAAGLLGALGQTDFVGQLAEQGQQGYRALKANLETVVHWGRVALLVQREKLEALEVRVLLGHEVRLGLVVTLVALDQLELQDQLVSPDQLALWAT